MSKDFDIDLLLRVAKQATRRLSKDWSTTSEDLEQDLLLHVYERSHWFEAYLGADSTMPLKERENKLFTALMRHGHEHLRRETEIAKQERGPLAPETLEALFEKLINKDGRGRVQGQLDRLPMSHNYRRMSNEEILKILPLILHLDQDIEPDLLEKVATVRNAVYACSKAQQEVIFLMIQGKEAKEIGEELGITTSAVRKRYSKARLHDKCDLKVYPSQIWSG